VDVIDHVVTAGIEKGVFPGAVVLIVHDGSVLKRAAYGHSLLYHDCQTRQEAPRLMAVDTAFDLASLTKVVVTTTAVMQLIEQGVVSLHAPVATYLPGFARCGKRMVTVRQLLSHTGGLPAGRPFYQRLRGADAIVDAVERTRLAATPGAQVIYSDLGFIALGALVARVTGMPLDHYAEASIFQPLGMRSTGYRPDPTLRVTTSATEYQKGRGLVWGSVHDENAAAMGGVSGHAGLFSTIGDLEIFVTTLLREGAHGPTRMLKPETVDAMFTLQTGALRPGRALGWQYRDPTYMGACISPHTVGHTGFTGTSIVLDLARHLGVVLLTNRVHPSRLGPVIAPTRNAVADAAVALYHDAGHHT